MQGKNILKKTQRLKQQQLNRSPHKTHSKGESSHLINEDFSFEHVIREDLCMDNYGLSSFRLTYIVFLVALV